VLPPIIVFSLLLSLLAACGGGAEDGAKSGDTTSPARPASLTAATLGEQQLLSNEEYLAAPPFDAADIANGERQAQICRACHSLDANGMNMIGPNLNGFFGRRAGTVADFGYSNVVLKADFAWTPRALDAWLAQPGQFMPGNMMSFAGVNDASDRRDLIAYLLQETR
jgi:cytochrome c